MPLSVSDGYGEITPQVAVSCGGNHVHATTPALARGGDWRRRVRPAGPAPTAPASAASIPEQLDQLATLHRQGTLSDDEFTTAKARLLSS